jgi:photosystem II stability/assembly factor-like uncharacterized protein
MRAALLLPAVLGVVCAQPPLKIDSATFGAVEARALGPARMSGRISAMAGHPKDPRIVYVGAAGGGLWKTTNGGVTFKPVFDRYNQSIGAVALDPQKPETVWVGTGEVWVRNSVSAGNGIYRSADGGENWQFLGLPESERIARIAVDPRKSDTVYAAVLGALWGDSEHRGVYKSTDGGKSWTKVLYVNPGTGAADLALDPQEPDILYAAMWQFRRQPWTFKSGGSGSGLHRSADGGKTWKQVKEGLPEGELGRIGLALAPSRPSTVYAVVEAKKTALYVSGDTGRTWEKVSDASVLGDRPFYYSRVLVDPADYKRVYKLGSYLSSSSDGGKSFSTSGAGLGGLSYHPDTHDLFIDPVQPNTLWLGTDGGVYKSLDRGATWVHLRNLPVSQFYHVSFDLRRPYHVYGGLQDNGSWTAPSEKPGGVRNADWLDVGMGDGFYVWPHPTDPNVVYSQYQGGKLLRFHRDTREIKSVAPPRRAGDPPLRFHWNTPVALSATSPDTLYTGAQFLYRSRDRGESWERISSDLTTNNPEKQKQHESGGLTIDNTAAENHCTIYAIAESPKDPRLVWVGTDDGNVQLTRDGGKTWTNLVDKIPGLPKGATISSVEASRHAAGAAWITVDNHMLGDRKSYLFATTDLGATWTVVKLDGVAGWAHIVREDPVRSGLLYLGTEDGLFLSLDGGQNWARFTGNFPNVAVRDLAIHPREHALLIATHGRGIYVIDDVTPFRQLNARILESAWAVLEPRPAPIRPPAGGQSFGGGDEFVGANAQEAAWITYWLKERHMVGDFTIEILDEKGERVSTVTPGRRRGLNRVAWAMRLRPPKVPTGGGLETGTIFGAVAPEGKYTARLVRDGETLTAPILVVGDPASPHPAADRQLQQRTVLTLYRLAEDLAYASSAAAEARDAARARAKGRDEKDPLAVELKSFDEAVEMLLGEIAAQREGRTQGITGEEKLRERVGALYSELSRFSGRPSLSQLERLAGIEKDAAAMRARVDAQLAGPLEALNAKLKTANLSPISRLTREAWEKKQQ